MESRNKTRCSKLIHRAWNTSFTSKLFSYWRLMLDAGGMRCMRDNFEDLLSRICHDCMPLSVKSQQLLILYPMMGQNVFTMWTAGVPVCDLWQKDTQKRRFIFTGVFLVITHEKTICDSTSNYTIDKHLEFWYLPGFSEIVQIKSKSMQGLEM